MPKCPECGSDLPPDEPLLVFEGIGVELPPTISDIIDSIGYGG